MHVSACIRLILYVMEEKILVMNFRFIKKCIISGDEIGNKT